MAANVRENQAHDVFVKLAILSPGELAESSGLRRKNVRRKPIDPGVAPPMSA